MNGWPLVVAGIIVVFVGLCSVGLCMGAGYLIGDRSDNWERGPIAAIIGWFVGFILMVAGVIYGGLMIYNGLVEVYRQ